MTSILLEFAEKKERKRMALALSHSFNGLFSTICWAVNVQKERQWVVQETIIKSKGNYQQMMRNLPTNVLESTSIKECNYLSGNFSIIFLLPFSVNKMNTQETKLQPFQQHTFYVSVTKQCSDWLVFLTVLSEQPIRTLFGKWNVESVVLEGL